MKALMKISFLLLGVTVICWGVYFYSGNRIITRKVLAHYQNDSLKLAAATFLLDNIGDKFAYCKEDIERYDTIFALYQGGYCSIPFRQRCGGGSDFLQLQLFRYARV